MKYKDFMLSDLFTVTNSKSINANNVIFGGKYPYVSRTEKNNGIIGYINEDINKLNPANTISFGQDTWTLFYQDKPYFTGNRVKVLSLKNHELNQQIALYLIISMKKLFSQFSWGASAQEIGFDRKSLSLPVKTKYIPDFNLLESIIENTPPPVDTCLCVMEVLT